MIEAPQFGYDDMGEEWQPTTMEEFRLVYGDQAEVMMAEARHPSGVPNP